MQTLTVQDILKPPFPPADHRIAYGPGPQQFGELRLPKGRGPFPVAIVIHGGCWLSQYDLQHIGRLSAALTQAGVATWTIEYRRVGDAGGGWPGTFDDVRAAAAQVDKIAADYHLDASRKIALGHSAGGHLALWLASQTKLRGVVSLAGVTDLRMAEKQRVCGDAVTQLMAGAPDYKRYSPAEMLPLHVAQRLVQGAKDPIVPLDMVRQYAEAAKRAGDDAVLTVIPDAGHFELIAPQSSAWPAVEKAVLDLLMR